MKPLSENGYGLCISGNLLEIISKNDSETNNNLQYISVFSRMRPVQKEQTIAYLKASGYSGLMCGDGTNDVGALKQADIGIAL
eukprot:Pgem_evm1s12757